MKYKLYISLFAVMILHSSCKKEFTCACQTWHVDPFITTGFDSEINVKSSKPKAAETCAAQNKSTTLTGGGSETTTCTLK